VIIDWVHKDDVQREMRRLIKRQLRVPGYAPEQQEALAEPVVELLKRRSGR
jgi:type I restriction enzyme R subunit